MTVLQSGLAKSLAAAYTIDQSLRFDDGDSAYLSRTFGASNRKTFTLSFWTKRCSFDTGDDQMYFAGGLSGQPRFMIGFGTLSPQRFRVGFNPDGSGWNTLDTTAFYRDPGAWLHIVVAVDTTQAIASNRTKLYINGEQVTAFDNESYVDQDVDLPVNSAMEHRIGANAYSDYMYLNSYLAEYYFIDGTAYDADDFGETDDTTNQWKPIDASGLTFGTNGFYQKYGSATGHTSFTSVGSTTWTAPEGVTSVDYLVVGGGGGGGDRSGGGGGAGGFRTGTLTVVGGTSYTVTVGAGGAGSTDFSNGSDGSDSVFSTITSTGGGGGSAASDSGGDGGSGGGGGNTSAHDNGGSGNTPSTTPSQGSDGGYGNDAPGSIEAGGGGGGASGAGGSTTSNTAGNGGAGTANSITGSSVTYAGGGGGSSNTGTDGSGGAGGGGAGDGSDGTANTGGGGGAAAEPERIGGDGGSGIVIVKAVAGQGFGLDSSGNGNNFTATNLVASDKMVDSPTNNFATFNPLINAYGTNTLSEGNLKLVTSAAWDQISGTMSVSSGKWYWEVYSSNWDSYFGIVGDDSTLAFDSSNTAYDANPSILFYCGGGGDTAKRISGSATAYGDGGQYASEIVGVALNITDSEITFYKDNVTQGAISFSGGIGSSASIIPYFMGWTATQRVNFGSDSSFAGDKTAQGNTDSEGVGDFYYEPPSGFLALCTSNLSDPSIALPGDNFNTVLYTGDGAADHNITGVGFQPDLTWIKCRSRADSHSWNDAVRGAGKIIMSNSTYQEQTMTDALVSFDTDGFTLDADTVGNRVNIDTLTYVAWNLLAGGGAGSSNTDGDTNTVSTSANVTAGFSISTLAPYAGSTTFGHGLSAAPELVIMKPTNGVDVWLVGSDPVDWTKALVLNTNAAESLNTAYWNNTAPTASVVSLGTTGNSYSKVFYCFHSVEGYSKIGAYSGNGNVDGTFVYTGFRPAFVMYKATNQAEDWYMLDDKRDTYNVVDKSLIADSSAAEVATTASDTDFVSNGFKLRTTTSGNWSGYNWLYLAFAEYPFKYSPAR